MKKSEQLEHKDEILVYDTNVLISSILTKHADSATALVVDAITRGKIIPVYNQEILDEYDKVLHRPKFNFSEIIIQKMLNAIDSETKVRHLT